MTDTTAVRVDLPGYTTGTWDLDPVHSEVSFVARHMMVSKVRGSFRDVSATLVTTDDPLDATVTATVVLESIDTGNEQRDAHLRSEDFFATERFGQMTYRSTAVRAEGDHFVVDGELTLKGVTKALSLDVGVNGFHPDPYGGQRCGFSATGELNRRDFNVDWNAAIEAGGVVVGDKIRLVIEAEFVLRQDEA